jgi:inorganic phosphate transporter, PiT family
MPYAGPTVCTVMAELRSCSFSGGWIGPKAEECSRFAESAESRAAIGRPGGVGATVETAVIVIVIGLAAIFGLVNGVHDAGNAIAAPVVTNALRPGSAIALATAFHVVGALVVGTAVAATVAGIVSVPTSQGLVVLGAAILGALAWSLATLWRGLPCSSGHCLVGALTGAALADGGVHAVHWGGLHGARPEGVLGAIAWLVFSTAIAFPLAWICIRLGRRSARRASRQIRGPIRAGDIVASAALAFAHGSNDAQKTMGLMAAALLYAGYLSRFAVPWGVVLASAALLALGTTLGGWRVVRTLGRRIYHLNSLDGLVSQSSAAGIVLVASLVGAPISTTDVVAPSIVGVGSGERWHHVRWAVVGEIALAWLVTFPVSAGLGALFLPLWRWAG